MAAGASTKRLPVSAAGLLAPALYDLLMVHEVPAERIPELDLGVEPLRLPRLAA